MTSSVTLLRLYRFLAGNPGQELPLEMAIVWRPNGMGGGVHRRFLLISDIHADSRTVAVDESPVNHVRANSGPGDKKTDPLVALMADPPEDIDCILVAGDICHRADDVALKFIWPRLHKLGQMLGTPIFAVPGNHDLDSRFHTYHDPRMALQNMENGFPDEQIVRNDQFWARHFLLDELGAGLVLLRVNSAAYHGYPGQHEHGRITHYTIDSIESAMRSMDAHTGVALFHHHLFKHPRAARDVEDDYSEMEGAELLIELFEDSPLSWIVIHGHRHVPRLFYAPGAGVSPPVVSLGAFGANLAGHSQAVLNSYHTLDLDIDDQGRRHPWALLRTFQFAIGFGWGPAPAMAHPDAMPHVAGFGDKTDSRSLAARLADEINATTPILRAARIKALCPELRYLIPKDLTDVIANLERNGLSVHFDDSMSEILEIRGQV